MVVRCCISGDSIIQRSQSFSRKFVAPSLFLQVDVGDSETMTRNYYGRRMSFEQFGGYHGDS